MAVDIEDLKIGDLIMVEENDEYAPEGRGVVVAIETLGDAKEPSILFVQEGESIDEEPWYAAPEYVYKIEEAH